MSAHPAQAAVGGPLAVMIMGVSGSGKSTVGARLAERLGWRFYDGDDFHPAANVTRMAAGLPLTDENRAPWLAALRDLVEGSLTRGESLVLACSALKEQYRRTLRVDDRVRFVYLRGSPELIARRQAARRDHFMPPSLLASQFATLEEPADAIAVDVELAPSQIVESILANLGNTTTT